MLRGAGVGEDQIGGERSQGGGGHECGGVQCFRFKHRPRGKGDTRHRAGGGWWAVGAAGTAGAGRAASVALLRPFRDFADGAVGFEHQLQPLFLLLQLLNLSLQPRFLVLQFVSLLQAEGQERNQEDEGRIPRRLPRW